MPEDDSPIRIETVDLTSLTGQLEQMFRSEPPVGYLSGKTAIRDAVASHLNCSLLQAEHLVDRLESAGHIVYQGNPEGPSSPNITWRFQMNTPRSPD